MRAIVELWRIGVTPEEIQMKLPHLNLAKVFDTLSYYNDLRKEIDRYIKKNIVPETLIDPLVKDLI